MSKIYKYTSLSSAIKIIRSNTVMLNNPSKFNDPFDCNLILDDKEKSKIYDLLFNYIALKVIINLINDNKINLTNIQKANFKLVDTELSFLKKQLNINPSYKKIPMISEFVKSIIELNPAVKIDLEKHYEEFNKMIEKNIKDILEKTLVSCFSKRNDSILMWSHYANSHKGACLEYERPLMDEFKDVEYTNKKPKLKMLDIISTYIAYDFMGKKIDTKNFDFFKHVIRPFFVKSKDWSYEEEVRCLFSTSDKNDNISPDGSNYFVNVGQIKKIYIGSRAKGREVDEILYLAKNRSIPVTFMKESEDEYKIIPNLNYIYKNEEPKNEEKISILRLVQDIGDSLNKELYIPAFALALNIPAICGSKAYPSLSEENQYKTWAHEWFSQYESSTEDSKYQNPYLSKDLLYDLRREYQNHGTFNIVKEYKNFSLDKFILRIEEKKPIDIYTDASCVTMDSMGRQISTLTINVRNFCLKMINCGTAFYNKNYDLFTDYDSIIIEDYNKIINDYNEYLVLSEKKKT